MKNGENGIPYRENLEDRFTGASVYASFNYRQTAGRMVGEHWHPYCELLYLFDGSAMQVLGAERFPLHAGDTLLIPSGAVHATDALEERCCIGVVQFPAAEAQPGLLLTADTRCGMARLFSGIQEEFALRPRGFRTVAQGLLLQILGYLDRFGQEVSCQTGGEWQHLDAYLRERLQHTPSLQEAAAYAGYSPAYFSRCFAERMGIPFKQYVDRMKMQAARGMLSGGATVVQTAAALGYETVSSFCRAFRRLTEQSPAAYRLAAQKVDYSG